MSSEVAEDPVAYKLDDEEPPLVEDGDDADNDESTLGSAEQERRERRRAKRKQKKRQEEDSDDDTYFSTSNEANKKKEDGVITKAIDRFVDLLNPVEKEMDDETLMSEATNGTAPTLTKEITETTPKPSLMQQLDKHVLTRFGCSSNPAYIPEDQAVETPLDNAEFTADPESTADARSTEGESMHGGDVSTYGVNSILQVDDPGDPDVNLAALDEEGNSSEEETGDGPRAFFCGAVPLKGEKGDSNVMSEIAEEKKTDDEQAKGIMYSPSQLEDLPFDQHPPKPAEPEKEPEAPADKGVFGSFTENFSPMLANIRSNLFPQEESDQSPPSTGDAVQKKEDSPASETAEPAVLEGETIFEEAAMEGHEVPPKTDDEPSEEGEEVPAILEGFARQESEMPFDQESDEAAKSEEEDDDLEEGNDDAEVEEESTQEKESPGEESPKDEETQEEEPKVEEPEEEELMEEIEVEAPVALPSKDAKPAAKSKKEKKKKKSIIGRMFKRKSKKDKAPKESILEDDEQKDFSPSERLIIPEEPEAKEARPVVPVDPTVTNKSKRESWQNARKQSAAKQELDAAIPKSDSADFDVLLTKTSSNKNAANDDWDKLTGPTTPTKSRPEGSSSSPAGVAEFPTGQIEI